MARTLDDLRQLQALPLSLKVRLTQDRLRQWVNEYGVDGCYVSFSGGKDSTVLLDIARQLYPRIPVMFADTGLEYPEIREFVRRYDGVDWVKPKKAFRKVIEDYGYPIVSKEISERVGYAQKYLRWYFEHNGEDGAPSPYGILDLSGIPRGSEMGKEARETRIVPTEIMKEYEELKAKGAYRERKTLEPLTTADGEKTQFDYRAWKWMALSPFKVSNMCCSVMKKDPAHAYESNGACRHNGADGRGEQIKNNAMDAQRVQWIQHETPKKQPNVILDRTGRPPIHTAERYTDMFRVWRYCRGG